MKPVYIYTAHIDEATKKQFDACVAEPYVTSAALMPDAHLGYAAPIGAVLLTKGSIVPAWVGFDIGCGVCAFKLSGISLDEVKKNANKIHSEVQREVPMGVGQKSDIKNITDKTRRSFLELVKRYQSVPHNKQLFNFFKTAALNHLGTLGGGNHFIELGSSGKDVWLVIHSGSRGVGHRIASHYMKVAADMAKKEDIETTSALPADSELGKEYLAIEEICLDYALLNRLEMGVRAIAAMEKVLGKKIKSSLWTNKNHNHVVREDRLFVHRKGATPAKKGERGVIPGNMRDGSVLVEGKGSKKFLNSSSHGAGRVMSRRDAKIRVSMQEFKESMSGITATVSESTLNEAPQVYKDFSEVLEMQKDSIKVVKNIKPLINWKGAESKFND